ncbi:carbohydrate ABC transporter permease [Paenibacillus frigoriresistens]|uniref:carbohydrate ABC transporter permease n=1 Tax=Paenibacillus alginolyticus TaxID=59839 RepID=UPI001566BEAD|nr:carbohydrate ABC transporter permease [Paenibacillus frigoriresistens]NRF95127.1 carbohydrate ABC transporter permease [Paenibacillus frigoriresistens]
MTKKHLRWIPDLCMAPACVVMLLPFYYIVVNTFKSASEASQHPLALPTRVSFENYRYVFDRVPLLQSFSNTVFITVASVLIIVLIGSMAAYPIVFNRGKLYKVLMFYLLCGFLIPFQSTLIPLFELMKNLGFINKIYGLIILYSSGCVFSFFLVSGYMRTIPKELEEAATIDGCSVWGIFWKIILPLLKPITITAVIFQTMWIWNDFLTPMLFLNSRSKGTLVLEIYRARGQFSVDWTLFLTLTVLVLLPILIFFIIMQKHIVKGMVGGALKG